METQTKELECLERYKDKIDYKNFYLVKDLLRVKYFTDLNDLEKYIKAI